MNDLLILNGDDRDEPVSLMDGAGKAPERLPSHGWAIFLAVAIHCGKSQTDFGSRFQCGNRVTPAAYFAIPAEAGLAKRNRSRFAMLPFGRCDSPKTLSLHTRPVTPCNYSNPFEGGKLPPSTPPD
jgi:hypothetical protein